MIPSQTKARVTWFQNSTLNRAGFSFCSSRYYTNGPYKADTSNVSNLPGFTNWASFYTTYRVVKYSYRADFCNLESFPVIISSAEVDSGISVNSDILARFGNPFTKKIILSPASSGKPTGSIRGRNTVLRVIGNPLALTDDNTASVINGVPASLTWLNYGVNCTGANVLVNGVTILHSITYDLEFFERTPLLS